MSYFDIPVLYYLKPFTACAMKDFSSTLSAVVYLIFFVDPVVVLSYNGRKCLVLQFSITDFILRFNFWGWICRVYVDISCF